MRYWREFPPVTLEAPKIGAYTVTMYGPVEHAREKMLTWISSGRWLKHLSEEARACVLCPRSLEDAVRTKKSHPIPVGIPVVEYWAHHRNAAVRWGTCYSATLPFKTIGEPGEQERAPALGGMRIWPGAVVDPSAHIDPGIYGEDTEIHAFAHIDNGVHVGHSAIIGRGVELVANTTVGGWVEIGPCSKIVCAHLRDGIKIGKQVLVGWGSNVVKDVPDGARVKGNPARIYDWHPDYKPEGWDEQMKQLAKENGPGMTYAETH
jgi:UDP-3-O-[3-hydroxymyristoyl] glucosamine N-acyltransferase